MEIRSLQHNEQALKLRALRNQVLSSNIANADTPNYKARDIDFAGAMAAARDEGMRLRTSSDLHVSGFSTRDVAADLKYRVPMQPSLDGNTVESDVEQAAFAENAFMYRATLQFLDGQVRSIKYAIKGGE